MSYIQSDTACILLVHSVLFFHTILPGIFWSRVHLLILSETVAFFYGVRPYRSDPHWRCPTCVRLEAFQLECKLLRTATFPHHASFRELEKSATSGCDLCRYIRTTFILHVRSYDRLLASKSKIEVEVELAGIPGSLPATAHLTFVLCNEISVNVYANVTDNSPNQPLRLRPIKQNKAAHKFRHALDIINELRLAREWLAYCCAHHSACADVDRSELPQRLLDVGDPQKRPSIFVTRQDDEILEANAHPPGYCALSYCWGPSSGHGQSIGLTKNNLSRYIDGIRWEDLPRTIQDAIIITRSLGLRYLWVDTLCIMQPNAGNDEDWYAESARMGDIYRNATCTICAQGASAASQGCFMERHWRSLSLKPCTLRSNKTSKGILWPFVLPLPVPDSDSVETAPLSSRGWTMQERYLSTRLLYWTKDGLFWECKTCRRSHPPQRVGGPSGTDGTTWTDAEIPYGGLLTFGSFNRKDIRSTWIVIAEDYSQRRLRSHTDRLVALSGMAKLFQPQLKSEYLAGLWRGSLPLDLLWSYNDGPNVDEPAAEDAYVAPSWSWASRPYPFSQDMFALYVLPEVEVQHGLTMVQKLSGDPYGALRDGQLCIQVPLLYITPETPIVLEQRQHSIVAREEAGGLSDGVIIFDETSSSVLNSLTCAIVAWSRSQGYQGLILEQLEGQGDNVYRRLGFIKLKVDTICEGNKCDQISDIDPLIDHVEQVILK